MIPTGYFFKNPEQVHYFKLDISKCYHDQICHRTNIGYHFTLYDLSFLCFKKIKWMEIIIYAFNMVLYGIIFCIYINLNSIRKSTIPFLGCHNAGNLFTFYKTINSLCIQICLVSIPDTWKHKEKFKKELYVYKYFNIFIISHFLLWA